MDFDGKSCAREGKQWRCRGEEGYYLISVCEKAKRTRIQCRSGGAGVVGSMDSLFTVMGEIRDDGSVAVGGCGGDGTCSFLIFSVKQ